MQLPDALQDNPHVATATTIGHEAIYVAAIHHSLAYTVDIYTMTGQPSLSNTRWSSLDDIARLFPGLDWRPCHADGIPLPTLRVMFLYEGMQSSQSL